MTRNRSIFGIFPFFLVLILCLKQQPLLAQNTRTWDLVKDFKAVADDRTDNYLAFARAAETISRAGGGQLNIPKGKYYIAGYKGGPASKGYSASDIIFMNCKNLTIIGNNSIIRVNGNFTRTRDYQIPGYNHFYSRKNTVCPFKLMNCKNVLLKDLTVYGEVDRMRKESVAEGESYGVVISDDEPGQVSSKIVIQNITAHHFAADGFLIKSNGSDILLNQCNSYKNARQGLSIVKGKDIKVFNSSFDSTGSTGAYGWHAPGAGIDVENEFGGGALTNVLIRNCNLRGNNGFQIVTTLSSDKVMLDSCFISDRSAGYSDGLNGVGMYSMNSSITNSIIFATIQVDIADQIYKGPAVQEISKNIIYSGHRGIVSADFSRPVNVTDNIFVMLPKPDMSTYFPYIQNMNARFNRNIVVVHADRVKTDPTNQVTALVQWAKEVKEDFWLVNGYNDMPLAKQQTYYYMPATNQAKVVNDHFFGVNDISGRYDFSKTHALTHAQVKAILNAELFTAYKQKSFNRKYISQANAVRNYTRGIVAAAKR